MPLFVLGSNLMGQLGLDQDLSSTNRPIEQPFFRNKNIVKIAAGKLHAFILCENNELYSWGVNDDRALGREGDERAPTPVAITQKIMDICCGASYSAILTERGQVFACGTFKSTSGVFGFDSTTKFQPTFKRIKNLRNIKKIFGGQNHIIMTDGHNNLWTVGANEQGQLGRIHRARNVKRCLEPFQVSSKMKRNANFSFTKAAGGGSHSMAINTDFECFGWGSNFNGQLGVGDTTSSEEKRIVLLDNVKSVACGSTHTIFLTNSNEVFGCGDNTLSQLGIEGTKMEVTPRFIIGNIDKIAAGCDFCIAQRGSRLLSWGSNLNGELGFDEIEYDEIKKPTEIDFYFGEVVDFKCGTDFVIIHTK
ncbi:uncharacterized protein VICG_00848 [Vittaforma corneae ATCC 50505]|uniref:RCC1-like domain-containing protein n=1 Tax=Vittaforma corneae (strain ATCC 50505) TaxID=993615 RepID=L2GNY1_VITCO|nr:uncharacterized protein VICG_00848 [Vittaforma corneae ATCC 50505]ELA42205.1 hypothetical protein VICG_00848 [Vittaforma corneae ATCC 50505]